MGTFNTRNPIIKGFASDFAFFNCSNLSFCFIIMSTLTFACEYSHDLYYLSFQK